ncbi:MAG: fatty acid CoA ligase family protein [Planctomycetota bacterium]|nr:fatty acid CoA ligase family protein [Planctomycetota bacterium]
MTPDQTASPGQDHLPHNGASAQPDQFNIAQYLPAMARAAPDRPAVLCPHRPDERGRTALTFKALDADSDQLAWGLSRLGLRPGERTLLFVRPGLEFVSITFALFKLGAVPVLIDPGMGRGNLLHCVRQSRPEALIAVPLVHALRLLWAYDSFDSVRLSVTVGQRWFWGGPALRHVRQLGNTTDPFPLAPTTRDTVAAILFTSGGTGIPKGVVYKHGMFDAQVAAIRTHYGIEPGEVDLPAFPLFALFSAALGTTCVIPDMDPTRPAQCNPARIVRAIKEHGVTFTFGSPSIWRRVGPYCVEKGITLPGLSRILMAGAPVRGDVLAPFAKILGPDADTYIPYGATEALPVASIRGSEVLNETWALTRQGRGYCLGCPLPGITVGIIAPEDDAGADPIQNPKSKIQNAVLPPGEIGEIVVSGDVVTHEYFEMPEQTALAKVYGQSAIRNPKSAIVWHRMGDMGYADDRGRLWFCGRKAHRVIMEGGTVLYSVCVEALCEEAYERLLGVRPRAALVGIGAPPSQKPAIIFESTPAPALRAREHELLAALSAYETTRLIRTVLYHPRFPVDIRHNAKINREALARWAQSQIANRGSRIP